MWKMLDTFLAIIFYNLCFSNYDENSSYLYFRLCILPLFQNTLNDTACLEELNKDIVRKVIFVGFLFL